ncbi:MAG: type I DNA topoisomerase [Eubacteriales bacterium]
MSILVIVESPSKANTIKGYLGSNYKVVASKGHVRDLAKSTLSVDIENNFEPHYINIRGKGDLIKELKKDAKASTKVYLATDADREGEAISWHLATVLSIPVDKSQRITFNEITKNAVREAIKNPRTIDMNLVDSQQTRRILDRIVGYKLSPFLWAKVRSGLSAGRVQSVATRIIVEREQEIRDFVPVEYWTVTADHISPDGGAFKSKFYGWDGRKTELHTKEDVDRVLAEIKGKDFRVSDIRKALKKKNPLPPFTTSTLQQDASRKLGFRTDRTMRVAQELYEGINIGSENGGIQGLITYMRTDSLRISSDAQSAAREYILGKFGDRYYPSSPRIYKSKADAQDAHEAIRPSNMKFEPSAIRSYLSMDQYRLYKLIWERFLASQMASAEIDTVTADITCGNCLFRANGSTVRFDGYRKVYEEVTEKAGDKSSDEESSDKLPPLTTGDLLKTTRITPEQHYTDPPPRFTEATLVKFLEEKGIGRPSTYATIISTIISRGYVNREGKALAPTALGETTTKLMIENFPEIVDYRFTAQMEDDLDAISAGEESSLEVLTRFYDRFKISLENADLHVTKDEVNLPPEETDQICEKCGARMIVKSGRFGKFAACPNYPKCKNTKPLVSPKSLPEPTLDPTELPKCEKCGSPMVLRNGRYGSFYACSRYPECKTTLRMQNEIGVPCPLCGKPLVSKRAKGKTVFYSCSGYPECQFSSWDKPSNEKCPVCGSMLYHKKGKPQLVCKKDGCKYVKELPAEGTVDQDGGTN